MYYGNSYGGYGNAGGCCGAPTCSSGYGIAGGFGSNYAIVLVLFILLIIILGCRTWNN